MGVNPPATCLGRGEGWFLWGVAAVGLGVSPKGTEALDAVQARLLVPGVHRLSPGATCCVERGTYRDSDRWRGRKGKERRGGGGVQSGINFGSRLRAVRASH